MAASKRAKLYTWRDAIPTPPRLDLAYLKETFGTCTCKQCVRVLSHDARRATREPKNK